MHFRAIPLPHRNGNTSQTLLIMKLFTTMMVAFCLQVSAAGFSQTVTLKMKNAGLQQVFREINRQTGYEFFFRDDLLKKAGEVDIDFQNLPVEKALALCFERLPLSYSVIDRTIVVREKTPTINQAADIPAAIPIRGRVTDAEGKPLSGASISVKNSDKTTITDAAGNFSIDAEPGQTLVVSYIGFTATEIVIRQGMPAIRITLSASVSELNAVALVSTGYQQLPKERSAGSFATVANESFRNKSVSMNLIDRLEGLVPGLAVGYGRNSDKFLLRGLTSINADRSPLFVVDGVPIYDLNTLTSLVNPEDVESVNVLRDATAASIWGAAAANGVVVVTTKKGKMSSGPKKVQVNYNGFASFRGQPDMGYYNLMSAGQLVAGSRQIFDAVAYPWTTVTTASSANSLPVVTPHEQVLYDLSRNQISSALADQRFDSLSRLNNAGQLSDLLYQQSMLTNHSLNFNGGSDYHSYYGSVSYTKDQGYNRNNLDRYQANLRQDFILSKAVRLDITANMAYEQSRKFLLPDFPGTASTILPYAMLADAGGNPLSMAYLLRHAPFRAISESQSRIDLNYVPLRENGYTRNNTTNLSARINAGLSIKLWKGLSYEGRAQYQRGALEGYDYYDQNSYRVRNERVFFTQAPATSGAAPTYFLPTTGGHYLTQNQTQMAWTIRNQLNYENTFSKVHQLSALAGTEARTNFSKTLGTFKRGYDFQTQSFGYVDELMLGTTGVTNPVNFLPSRTINVLTVNQHTYGETDRRFFSLYGNVAYTYDRRYTLNGSVRMDQSNLFGSDPSIQYKPIWSIGGAWNISRENFFKSDLVNNLKLRLTYGLAGNAPIPGQGGPYDIVGARNNAIFAGLGTGYVLFTPRNDLLTWERTATTNIGIDFGLFDNRLSGSIDAYDKQTSNLLGFVPIDPTTGFSYAYDNLGGLSNKGLEIMLNGVNIKSKDFQWRTTLTLSYNRNKITELKRNIVLTQSNKISGTQMEGYSAYPIFGYNYIGLDANGNPLALNATKDTVRLASQLKVDDPMYAGTTQPLWYGGITNQVSYKNFSLSFLIVYNLGHMMRRDVNRFYTGRLINNLPTYFNDRWKVSGDETKTDVPKYIANTATNTSTRNTAFYTSAYQNIESASYLRLRDLTLNYALPADLVKKLSMSDLSVYGQVNNVLLWTKNKHGIDPEYFDVQAGLRTERMPAFYTFGIRASF
jgi:TonB-linked SusC/RagA family outer membrane protein